jgi:hypothetical protein
MTSSAPPGKTAEHVFGQGPPGRLQTDAFGWDAADIGLARSLPRFSPATEKAATGTPFAGRTARAGAQSELIGKHISGGPHLSYAGMAHVRQSLYRYPFKVINDGFYGRQTWQLLILKILTKANKKAKAQKNRTILGGAATAPLLGAGPQAANATVMSRSRFTECHPRATPPTLPLRKISNYPSTNPCQGARNTASTPRTALIRTITSGVPNRCASSIGTTPCGAKSVIESLLKSLKPGGGSAFLLLLAHAPARQGHLMHRPHGARA